jgi:hypothetical protein
MSTAPRKAPVFWSFPATPERQQRSIAGLREHHRASRAPVTLPRVKFLELPDVIATEGKPPCKPQT